VYTLVFALFFAPPAGVDQPEHLVRICRLRDGRPEGHAISYAEYVHYREHATAFTELAGDGNVKRLTDTDAGNQLLTAVVSPSYFTVLGLRPRAGRFFLANENTVGGHDNVVVLSHGFWQRRFAGDSRIVGGPLLLAGRAYVIVGVTPPGFIGSSAGWTADIFLPVFSEAELGTDNDAQLDLIGRLAPGRTLADAQAEISVLGRTLDQPAGDANRGAPVVVFPLRGLDPEARAAEARLPTLLVAAVACLLTIACVNLAGLLQTRHAARRKEIAIRLALGAGRTRLVRQLLTESLLLCTLGGTGGLVIAWWGTALLERGYARDMFDGTRHFYPLTLDARDFLLTFLTALATGVVFGLVPAWQASCPVLVPALKEDVSSTRRSRLRAVFLVVQVALSTVLLIGAGLALQSALTVSQDPGFDARHVAYLNITPARAGYRGEKATRYGSEVLRRLESVPLVESASLSWVPPPMWAETSEISLPGHRPARPADTLHVRVNWVSARFFETLRIPALRGRGIEQHDIDRGRALVVMNEALVRLLWTDQDPLDRTLIVDGQPFDVIGIVHYAGLRAGGDAEQPYLFRSDVGRRQQGSVFVRVKGDVSDALPTLRREILAVDPAVPITQAMPLSSVVADQEVDVAIAMGVLSVAGGLALFLTVVGLYGVTTLWVSQRTREIGIRVALGARSSNIVTLVLLEALRLVVIGLPLGVVAARVGGRLLSATWYGVSATDTATFSVITAAVAIVALLAAYVPARRALRVNPVQALRHD